MGRNLDSIAAGLLALPAAKRAKLAETLLRSLDRRRKEAPGEVKTAWVEESERRLQEVINGKDCCLDGDEVQREVRNRKRTA